MNNLQGKILDVFKEVKKICDKHNLRYFAIGGTCIGAVRHKGFIPWDDDLDIAMPYKDYLKFYEIAKAELPQSLVVYTLPECEHTYGVFMKVYDKNTAYIEKTEFGYPDSYKGIFIDIMPLCGLPEKYTAHMRKLRTYVRLNSFRRMFTYERSVANNPAKLAFAKTVHNFGPYDLWSKKWEKCAKKYDFDKSEYTGFTWSGGLVEKKIFPVEWFSDYVELPFEDTTIRCPIEYDKMLTKMFGDYMKLPPKEQQVGHHFAIIDLDNSYEKYKELSYDELIKIMNEQEEI